MQHKSVLTIRRRGVSLLELLVSGVVLVTVMTLVTTLCIRISSVWKDVGHHRVAVAELSNHLDRLTRLDANAAQQNPNKLRSKSLNHHRLVHAESVK